MAYARGRLNSGQQLDQELIYPSEDRVARELLPGNHLAAPRRSADRLTKEGLHAFLSPEQGTILGALALFIALGGTAFATGATVVNIGDPTTPAHIVHVNASGQLAVAGPVRVTNTIGTELAAPSTYLHSVAVGLNAGSCTVVAEPPAGKAMIIRDVRIDVYADPSPGEGENLDIYKRHQLQ